jgi:hypothetical protein
MPAAAGVGIVRNGQTQGRQPRSEGDFIDGAGYELASTPQDCPLKFGLRKGGLAIDRWTEAPAQVLSS